MSSHVTTEAARIARDLHLSVAQVERTIGLLDEGNTVPFITRYRRDQTGGLDEEQIRAVKQAAERCRALEDRKATILKSIQTQGKLTDELRIQLEQARSIKRLEDLYLPFKPKKQTLSTLARQRGLEPLAQEVLAGEHGQEELAKRAQEFVRVDRELPTIEDVFQGVGHLLAEVYSEDFELRSDLRRGLWRSGKLKTTAVQREAGRTKRSAESETQPTPQRVEPVAELPTEPVAELPSEPVAELPTEPVAELPSEPVAELPSEPVAELPSEPVAELPSEPVAELPSEPVAELPSEPVAELPSEPVAELPSEPVAELPSEPVAELPSEPVAELPTEPVAELPTEPVAAPTEPPSPPSPAAESSAKTTTAPMAKGKPSKKDGAKQRRKKKAKVEEAYADYFEFEESLAHLPPHRILAINRGERAKAIRVRCVFDDESVFEQAQQRLIPAEHPQRELLLQYLRDSMTRLLIPSLEREIRRELTDRAETHAVEVFAQNLRNLLLQRPVNGRRVLAVDPGYKSGCKMAVLDEMGSMTESHVIFVVGNEQRRKQGREWLVDAMRRHGVKVIAIGNGTASRAAEELVAAVLADELKDAGVAYAIVNEAGASVYSTSTSGREELPDLDPTIRSAVSIGRRLLDPLSELVKISPEHLGVGMYQHDVKARHLRDSLDEVVASCVNYVGVDANTASPALLKYVSGLNQLSARRFVEFRKEHGPFRSREQFRNVAGFGDATFVQAAGFLKINQPDQVLDATWIHPESYELTEKVLQRLECSLADLAAFLQPNAVSSDVATVAPVEAVDQPVNEVLPDAASGETSSEGAALVPERVVDTPVEPPAKAPPAIAPIKKKIATADVRRLAEELQTGELLVKDILAMLLRPGRDPRDSLPPPVFRTGATRIEDLQPGMALDGRVLNVVDFGVFVDIGLSESGLVHISRLARGFVKDPHQNFAVGQPIRVWVVEVDKQRRRVSLTAIDPALPPVQRSPSKRPARPASKGPASGHSGGPPRKRPERKSGQYKHPPRPARPKPPPKPLTPEVAEGKAPMRSFTELLQFYEHKKSDS